MKRISIKPGDADIKFKNNFLDYEKSGEDLSTPEELKFETVTKPWGYEYLLYSNRDVAIWLLKINSGQETSMHMHLHKKTIMIPLVGEISISGSNNKNLLQFGDILEIDIGTLHKTFASVDSYLIEVETPNLKLDLLRYEDRYGRTDSTYEGQDFYSKNSKNYDFIDLDGNIESKIVQKYIKNRNIMFCKMYSNELKRFASEGNMIMTLENIRLNIDEIIYAGTFLDTKDIEKIGIGIDKRLEIMIIENKQKQVFNTFGYLLASSFEQNQIYIFSSIGESNIHLVEIMARMETLNLYLFPSDEIALDAAFGFGKTASKKVIFIPSSYGQLATLIPKLISYWVDSKNINILFLNSWRTRRLLKRTRQTSIKNYDVEKIFKTFSNKIWKITAERNFFNKINRILEELFDPRKTERPGPNLILIPQHIISKFTHFKPERTRKFSDLFVDKFLGSLQNLSKLTSYFLTYMYFLNFVLLKMKKAKNPVFILGAGLPKNVNTLDFIRVLENLKIPIFTTRSSIELFPSDSSTFFGRVGGYGDRISNLIVNSSDLIICIGARLSTSMTTRNTADFAPDALKFVIDIDRYASKTSGLKKVFRINCDAGRFAHILSSKISRLKLDYTKWFQRCEDAYEKSLILEAGKSKFREKSSAYLVLTRITAGLGERDINIAAGGKLLHVLNQSAVVKKDQQWINFSSMESDSHTISTAIGCGIGLAEQLNYRNLGIKINVFCEDLTLLEDYSSLKYVNDFEIPIRLFVLIENNRSQINYAHNLLYSQSYVGKEFGNRQDFRDFIKSLSNFRVIDLETKNSDLETLSDQIDFQQKPTIYIISTTQNSNLDPRPFIYRSVSGEWLTKSLVDMYPDDAEYDAISLNLRNLT